MTADPMDRIERILTRWIEEDRRERRRKREQRKAGTLPESEKRIEDWLRRAKKEIEDRQNKESPD